MVDSLHKWSVMYKVIWYTMPASVLIALIVVCSCSNGLSWRLQWWARGETVESVQHTDATLPTTHRKNGIKISINKPPKNDAAMYHRWTLPRNFFNSAVESYTHMTFVLPPWIWLYQPTNKSHKAFLAQSTSCQLSFPICQRRHKSYARPSQERHIAKYVPLLLALMMP